MSEKNVNYTPEMVARMHEAYDPESSETERELAVRSLAEELGKNTKSIRAKLVREGIYVAKEPKSKTGGKPETKEKIVADIARTLGVDADTSLSGLEKATKNCLLLLRKTFEVVTQENVD